MTTDEENFYIDNINIAYKIAWQYHTKFRGYIDIEELKSICLLGLVKAVKSFNNKLGFNFSTYAYKVIQNEILMFTRANSKWNKNISLNTKLDGNGDTTIEDILEDNFDIDEKVNNSICSNKLYIELEHLHPRYRNIIHCKLQGMTMTEIGKRLNLSQPQISRDYKKILSILRQKFNIMEEI